MVSFLLQMTSTFLESSPPLSASVLSLKAFQIFLLFLRTSKDESVYQPLEDLFFHFCNLLGQEKTASGCTGEV